LVNELSGRLTYISALLFVSQPNWKMNQRIVITILMLVLSATSKEAFCQRDQFGQMIFDTPTGWVAHKFQDGVALLPSPLPSGEKLFIQILQAANFSTSFEAALEMGYDEVCAILRANKMREVSGMNYTAREAKRSFKGWEYIRGSGGIQVANGTPYPDEFGLELFVIRVNKRFERIAIVQSRNTCGGLSKYYPSDRRHYRKDIENFLFSLKFDDWQEPFIESGTIRGDGITGVWQGLGLSVGSSGAALKGQNLILFSNGQAYYGSKFPVEGLDNLDTWISAENNRRSWGSYTFSSGKGILKMPYGEMPLQMGNNKLILTSNKTDHGFIKLNSVDDAKLNGSYFMREAYGMIPSIHFSSDGGFIDKGAVRILYHEYIECLNLAITPGSGTYKAKNHTLLLNYSDGRMIKIAFPGIDFDKNNLTPASLTLSFNEDLLKRE
jgi:hypothetical protein